MIAVGDLVMVHDENQPRAFWRIAKIEKLITGRDGKIRGATVKVSSRNGRVTALQRPISLLYPLEINCHYDDDDRTAGASTDETSTENPEPLAGGNLTEEATVSLDRGAFTPR